MQVNSQQIRDVFLKGPAQFLYNQEVGLDLYLQFNNEQFDKM